MFVAELLETVLNLSWPGAMFPWTCVESCVFCSGNACAHLITDCCCRYCLGCGSRSRDDPWTTQNMHQLMTSQHAENKCVLGGELDPKYDNHITLCKAQGTSQKRGLKKTQKCKRQMRRYAAKRHRLDMACPWHARTHLSCGYLCKTQSRWSLNTSYGLGRAPRPHSSLRGC